MATLGSMVESTRAAAAAARSPLAVVSWSMQRAILSASSTPRAFTSAHANPTVAALGAEVALPSLQGVCSSGAVMKLRAPSARPTQSVLRRPKPLPSSLAYLPHHHSCRLEVLDVAVQSACVGRERYDERAPYCTASSSSRHFTRAAKLVPSMVPRAGGLHHLPDASVGTAQAPKESGNEVGLEGDGDDSVSGSVHAWWKGVTAIGCQCFNPALCA